MPCKFEKSVAQMREAPALYIRIIIMITGYSPDYLGLYLLDTFKLGLSNLLGESNPLILSERNIHNLHSQGRQFQKFIYFHMAHRISHYWTLDMKYNVIYKGHP